MKPKQTSTDIVTAIATTMGVALMGTVVGGSTGSIIGGLVGAGLGITTGVIGRVLLSGEGLKGEDFSLLPKLIENLKEQNEIEKQLLDEARRTVFEAPETPSIASRAEKEKVDPSQE